MYAAADRPGDAARQFELARRLAPRDIFILRRLGKSYLDKDELEQTRAVLETIEALDPRAFETNIENAALKARLHEKSNNLVAARDLLIKALESNPTSYYLGDLLGQALLALGDTERAKETYQRVQTILRDLREQNVWTQATALTAALVCEDEAAAARALREIRDVKPTRGELESIERGVNKVITVLGRGDEVLDSLRSMERDRRDGK
jgi:tetratricopeptide (TPR) repeat protein